MMDHAIVVYGCPTAMQLWHPGTEFREKFAPDITEFCRLESVEKIVGGKVYLSTADRDDASAEVKKRQPECFIAGFSFQEIIDGKLTELWGGAAELLPKFASGGVVAPRDAIPLFGERSEEFLVKPSEAQNAFAAAMQAGSKDTNPKDAVGVRKWRQFTTVSQLVLAEVGVGMLEGARKYGRHNYRVAGVRASVYVDAAMGHVVQWWEGEDTDADSGLSHITKAICSLFVLRDAMIQGMLTDDRPPKGNLDLVRQQLQEAIDSIFERHPNPVPAYTQADESREK